MNLTAAQQQAVETLKANFAPDAQSLHAVYLDGGRGRMISKATMGALVDKGILKVKRVNTRNEDVRGSFGRGAVQSTRYYSEAEYIWA
jgi:hypothetical protein